MNLTENIDYNLAVSLFDQAEKSGHKLVFGNLDSNFWLHKENINLDFVIKTAKNFSDSRIFIISDGDHKGFYIYSNLKKVCIKLTTSSNRVTLPVIV